MTNHPQAAAKYLSNFGGWLAFCGGRTLRTIDQRVKVFKSEAAAMDAANKSAAARDRYIARR